MAAMANPAARKGAKPAPKIAAPRRAKAARHTSLAIDVRESVALVALARPDVHNAFDETLIAELTEAAARARSPIPAVRVVVLLGHGRSFCAGADLNWMKRMAGYGRAENLADATALAAMLRDARRMSQADDRARARRGLRRRRRPGRLLRHRDRRAGRDVRAVRGEARAHPGDHRPVRDRGDRRARRRGATS